MSHEVPIAKLAAEIFINKTYHLLTSKEKALVGLLSAGGYMDDALTMKGVSLSSVASIVAEAENVAPRALRDKPPPGNIRRPVY